MRTARIIAVLLFLLPIAQLALAQQMDEKSLTEIRGFHLTDDLMLRYNGLVQASTAARAHRVNTEAWPPRTLPGVLPRRLDTAGALLESSEPLGPMLRQHHLTGKQYLCILIIRMGATEALDHDRAGSADPTAERTPESAPLCKPWVSAENLQYLAASRRQRRP